MLLAGWIFQGKVHHCYLIMARIRAACWAAKPIANECQYKHHLHLAIMLLIIIIVLLFKVDLIHSHWPIIMIAQKQVIRNNN